MKVLLHGYNTCCQNKAGGVQIRIRKIHELLRQNNIEADYFSVFESDLRNYDVLHVFQLGFEARGLIFCAKRLGLKVILSSIVPINAGRKLRVLSILNKLKIPTLYKYDLEILHAVDTIIAESYKEARYIQRYYKIPSSKIHVIPNGIDKSSSAGDAIFDIVPCCKYVLQVGRFDENKNQLNVIRAVKGTDINVVFIGGADETISSKYYEQCLVEAKGCKNIYFLGWRLHDDPIFMSALKHAHALILPSYYETFGLVALEGAINGAEVCLSNTLPLNDFELFDKSLTFSPSSIIEIRTVLQTVINRTKNINLQSKVETFFSWKRIIDMHIDLYKK